MSDENVYDLTSKLKAVAKVEKPKGSSGKFEFHLMNDGEVAVAEGFLKFGPGFTAIVEGPEDEAAVVFAAVTSMIKYIKRIGSEGEVQGTLSV